MYEDNRINLYDKKCLKPVCGQFVLSQLVSKVNNSSQISQTEGVIHWEEVGGGAEDKWPSTSRLRLVYLFWFATSTQSTQIFQADPVLEFLDERSKFL